MRGFYLGIALPLDAVSPPTHVTTHVMSVLQILLLTVGIIFVLQILTVLALSVVGSRRKHRPFSGFPHMRSPEIAVGENQLHIYSYGRELYDAMLAAIEYAKESIFLETYLFKGDAVGEEFKEKLARKAAEGVAVYVSFDGFGNTVVPRAFKRFPPQVHVFTFQAMRRPWHLLDPRRYVVNHRKLLVVDGKIGFIGGYNLGSLYSTEWRDTHLRIRGPAAADLAQSFIDFWNRHYPGNDHIKLHYPRHFDPLIALRGTDAMRLTFPIRDMYIEAIDRAEKHILLTNAYFVPDGTLLDALKSASGRGVDVQLLVPWTSNHILADWMARGHFTECLRAGVRIFGYRRAMIHAKTCTIDGVWSTIGTANLDRLSSVGNYEINMEIFSEELAQQMEAIFECDKTNAFELKLEAWTKRPWYMKFSEGILAPLRVML